MRLRIAALSVHLVAALSLCASGTSAADPVVSPALPQAYVRVGPGPRYLRIDSVTFANRDRVTSTEIDDLKTGRSVEYDTDALGTSSTGFDGRRSWSTDNTGLPVIDDTPEGRLSILVYARLSGRPGPEHIAVTSLARHHGQTRVRLRYKSLSGPIDVTMTRGSPTIAVIDDFTGGKRATITLSDYRRVENVLIPFRSGDTSDAGSFYSVVSRVRSLVAVPDAAFAPPAFPNDTELAGTTTVRMTVQHHSEVVVPIRINGGPTLHVAFDSGSTNYLAPRTARRLGLSLVGLAKSGGVGAGLVDEQYARVETLDIGAARMHGIPFSVLDDGSELDGTIGCEVLERLAVQFDFSASVVRLSRSPSALPRRGMPIPIRTGNCGADLDARLDGLPGTAMIDTGSGVAADVMSPFVRAHHLIAKFRATEQYSGGGIGGRTEELLAQGGTLAMGPFRVRQLDLMLSTMRKGAFSDPTAMVNVGLPILRRFTLSLDYRSHRMWLRQAMPIRHVPFFMH